MTRKHFKAIAESFKNNKPNCTEANWEYCARQQWASDIEAMANTLAQFNPRFDKEKFIKACKGE